MGVLEVISIPRPEDNFIKIPTQVSATPESVSTIALTVAIRTPSLKISGCSAQSSRMNFITFDTPVTIAFIGSLRVKSASANTLAMLSASSCPILNASDIFATISV